MALPSNMTTTHLDAGTDDPKQARAELATNAGLFNALLTFLAGSDITKYPLAIGDGLENLSNTHIRLRDGNTVKRKGTNGPPEVALGYAAKTSAYTVVAADRGKLIDCTANTFTVTLTAAATLGADFWFMIRNSGSGTITVDPNSTEQIDGASTLTLAQGESAFVICTGTAFKTVGAGGGGGGAVDIQIFTTSGTWSKPSDASVVLAIGWGGGGGGSSAGGDAGGGGGACVFAFWQADDLGATETVTIGASGNGSSGGSGGTGGSTTFDKLTAYGGGGGGASGDNLGGGGGGGWLSAGSTGNPNGTGGAPGGGAAGGGGSTGGSGFGGGGGGRTGAPSSIDGGHSAWGGGGGGASTGAGGKSVWGGGGGGGNTAGTSVFGGNGGAQNTNGSAPGGGGGRGNTNGARGELWVISW